MTKNEIKLFNKFLNERGLLLMFHNNYRKNHFLHNPEKCAEYLEKSLAERVIPLAFTFPKKTAFDKEFWLEVHREWTIKLSAVRPKPKVMEKLPLHALGINVVELKERHPQVLQHDEMRICYSKKYGRFTLNSELSKKLLEQHFDHLILATGKDNDEVLLLFSRTDGVKILYKVPGKNSPLSFCSKDCVTHVMKLLKMPKKIGNYVRKVEVVNDNTNYLMIKVA